MKASIIFNSQHGATKAYAEEIGKLLTEKGVDNKVASIDEYNKEYLKAADIVLLGCWTGGLFIFAQHPDKAWKNFAKDIPDIKSKKLGLFTTYKLATGSMFRKMENCITDKADAVQLILKSKSSNLTEDNKKELESFIQ